MQRQECPAGAWQSGAVAGFSIVAPAYRATMTMVGTIDRINQPMWRRGTAKPERPMFDAVVGDLSERYGLGDRSRELFGLLVGYIFNDRRGGFGGFVEGFREQGHGDLVAAWFGNPASALTLNAGDVGTVFGQGLLNDWSLRLGTSRATLAAAIAGVLPRLVAELTPGGRLPAVAGMALPGNRPLANAAWATSGTEPRRIEPVIALRQGPPAPLPASSATATVTMPNRADAMVAALAAPAGSALAGSAPGPAFDPYFRRQPQHRRGSGGWLLWLLVVALIAGGIGYAWSLGLLDPYLRRFGLQ